MDFVQYRWVIDSGSGGHPYVDQNGMNVTLNDSVVLDITGVDSSWVQRRRFGPDSLLDVLVTLNPYGAAAFGATTATHVGRMIAVVIDGHIVQTATVNSPLGPIVPLASLADRQAAESLAVRVNRVVRALGPVHNVHFIR